MLEVVVRARTTSSPDDAASYDKYSYGVCVHLPQIETLTIRGDCEFTWAKVAGSERDRKEVCDRSEVKWYWDDRDPPVGAHSKLVVEVLDTDPPYETDAKYAYLFRGIHHRNSRMTCGSCRGDALHEFELPDEVSKGEQVACTASASDIGALFPTDFTLRLYELIKAGAYLRFDHTLEPLCRPYCRELVLPEGFISPPHEPPFNPRD